MVISHLARHWLARRHYSPVSLLACIARSLRVLLFYREHGRLLALPVYREHLVQIHDDVFHHLSHRDYLVRGLPLRERVRCVGTHYRFEEARFDSAYRQAVYRDGGLVLWRQETAGRLFEIRLALAPRLSAEGDLILAASVDGICLHRLSFSWTDGVLTGTGAAIVPFIARNQGHRLDAGAAFSAFELAYPNNSPSFFCFAALQGVAGALEMDQVVAVRAARQCAYSPAQDRHFANAYDGFWRTLGGIETPQGYRIALPLPLKPLSGMPSRRRKRAALRREHWRAIGESARLALLGHLQSVPAAAMATTRSMIVRPTAHPG